MNGLPHIETVWAIICTDKGGTEGVPAITGDDGVAYPLYVTNEKNVPGIVRIGAYLAFSIGSPCVLAKFTAREDTPLPVAGEHSES